MAGGKGELNCSAKLTEHDIIRMRRMNQRYRRAVEIMRNNSLQAIADRFGVDRQHVYRIVNYRRWKHVTPEMVNNPELGQTGEINGKIKAVPEIQREEECIGARD